MSMQIRRMGTLSWADCKGICLGGYRSPAKIGPNTYIHLENGAEPDAEQVYTVRFHGSAIIEYHPDGAVLLYSRGYQSATTKQRLSALSPAHVYQVKGEWFVGKQKFYEGMNVGKPRNEREALEKGMREGDELAARMLADMEQGI